MFKSHLLIAWRSLWKTRVSSFINIAGLSAGMICFIVILFFVRNEESFDTWNKHADRTYRVVKDFINADGTAVPDATTPPALAPALARDLPEVATATRIFPAWGREYLIKYKDKGFYETKYIRIDSNFFKVFDLPFVRGNKAAVFSGVRSILMTETAAKKFFGNEDPIGKTVRINVDNGQDFVVAGVLKDVPQNSHFTFDYLVRFVSRFDSTINQNWNFYGFYTYVLLKPGADPAAFNAKLQPLFAKYQPESRNRYYSQLLTDIHLRSKLKWELGMNGDLSYLHILMAIAIFVIVIAGVNYINLATAQSLRRAREAGIRKVAGASRQLLVMQFLIESVCTAFVSLVVAVAAIVALQPLIEKLTDRAFPFFAAAEWTTWMELIAITLFIGLAAGIYPALHYSSFQPIKALKGKFMAARQGAWLRKGLVVLQFAISILLMAGFFTIYRQVGFMLRNDMGFNKDNILLIPNVRRTGLEGRGAPGSWVDDVRRLPFVTNVARADGVPGGLSSTNGVSTRDRKNHISLNFFRIDHAFLPALQIQLKAGRNFYDHPSADSASIILNEMAVAQLGLKAPYLGQQLQWDDDAGRSHPVTIVGVVKDFHFSSLHEPIKPFGFVAEENNGSNFFVRVRSSDLEKDIEAIQKIWLSHNPDKPFEFSFLDERIAKLYRYDQRFQQLFTTLTILALGIACMGLLGLSIFTTEARSREIGVRKVLGASARSLFTLLSKDFLVLIGIAFIFASPVAWWAMSRWLDNFAYRITLSPSVLILSGATAVIITLATISLHTIKAVRANPVRRLRSE